MSNNKNSKHVLYEQIYNDYKIKIFDYQEEYYDWYRQANNLIEAIKKAFKSEDEKGRVHGHQHRVGRKVLKRARNEAIKTYKINNLSEKDFNTFDKIYTFVGSVKNIDRFGELAHYDVSLRIAKYQDTKYYSCGCLKEVYLHRGTFKGTKAIFNAGDMDKSIQKPDIREGERIKVSYFPHPLNQLSGDHLENLLCIYKKDLEKRRIFNARPKACMTLHNKFKTKSCI